MLPVRRPSMLDKKFTGSVRLVGHLRHCLEPVMPKLGKHHGKADAGFGSVRLRRMLLRVIEKHEAPPFTQQPQRRSRPDGLASNDCVANIAQFLIYVHGSRPYEQHWY